MPRVTEFKKASELTYADIGKRIKGMHGSRGLVTDKPRATLCTIKEIAFTHTSVRVTVYRNRYETTETSYFLDEEVKLTYFDA